MKILVYGYYHKSNLGDDLFIDAFKGLFPMHEFTFVDKISNNDLINHNIVFFGGGSFLAESLKLKDDCFDNLKLKSLFYIGVGSETQLNPKHLELIKLAKLVAIRSESNLDYIKSLNENVIVIPDIVYSLKSEPSKFKFNKSILIIPNVLVVPKYNEPQWKYVSWEYFKIELAQSIDDLIKKGYQIDYLSLCENNFLNDSFAAAEIISKTTNLKNRIIYNKPNSIQECVDIISKYDIVVTQRFHGQVLSDISFTPSLTIYHHDKLKNVNGKSICYYEFSKASFIKQVEFMFCNQVEFLPIDRNIFTKLIQRVNDAICGN